MNYRNSLSAIAAAATAAFLFLCPTTAQAMPIAACGNIDFAGATSLTCSVETSGGCTANCQPINCTASVTAGCTGSASATCTGGCTGTCMGQCTAMGPSFSCSGNCSASCMGNCSGECSSMGNTSTCMGQCMASCTNQCDVS